MNLTIREAAAQMANSLSKKEFFQHGSPQPSVLRKPRGQAPPRHWSHAALLAYRQVTKQGLPSHPGMVPQWMRALIYASFPNLEKTEAWRSVIDEHADLFETPHPLKAMPPDQIWYRVEQYVQQWLKEGSVWRPESFRDLAVPPNMQLRMWRHIEPERREQEERIRLHAVIELANRLRLELLPQHLPEHAKSGLAAYDAAGNGERLRQAQEWHDQDKPARQAQRLDMIEKAEEKR